ncbi:MAG: hypothetical protein RLZ35_547 [Pseudomonadota bacterium]|jgi:hypothetical protein
MIGISDLKAMDSTVKLEPDKTLSEYRIIFEELSGHHKNLSSR